MSITKKQLKVGCSYKRGSGIYKVTSMDYGRTQVRYCFKSNNSSYTHTANINLFCKSVSLMTKQLKYNLKSLK